MARTGRAFPQSTRYRRTKVVQLGTVYQKSGVAVSAYVPFPAPGGAPILDNANRANEGPPPSSNWTSGFYKFSNTLKVVSNTFRCTAAADQSDAYWNPQTFGPDCRVESTFEGIRQQTQWIGARLTTPGSGTTDGYIAYADSDISATPTGIYRLDNGVATRLGAAYTGYDSSVITKFSLSIVGSTLILSFLESGVWVDRVTRTDATYSAAGYVGAGMIASSSTDRFDDFAAGQAISVGEIASGGKAITFNKTGAGVSKLYATGASEKTVGGGTIYQKAGAAVATSAIARGARAMLRVESGTAVLFGGEPSRLSFNLPDDIAGDGTIMVDGMYFELMLGSASSGSNPVTLARWRENQNPGQYDRLVFPNNGQYEYNSHICYLNGKLYFGFQAYLVSGSTYRNKIVEVDPYTLQWRDFLDVTLLPAPDTFTVAEVATDGTYLYIATRGSGSTDTKIYKYDTSGSLITSIVLTGLVLSHPFDCDGSNLYIGGGGATPWIAKVLLDLSTFTSLSLTGAGNLDDDIAFIGTDVWLLDESSSGKVVVVPKTLASFSTFSLATTNGLDGLCVVSGTVWISTQDSPAVLYQVDASTHSTLQTINLASGENSVNEIVYQPDNTLWLTTYTTPAKLIRIPLGTAKMGVAVKTSGGTVYNKSGFSISNLVATGADADTFQETGAGVSAHYATGADQDTLNRTGTSVSDHIATGTKQATYAETGKSVSDHIAMGPDQDTLNRTGASVSDHIATGPKQVFYAETGKSVSDHIAIGPDQDTLNRTGVSVSGHTATGADADTFQETGASVSDHIATGSRTSAVVYAKTGASVSKIIATGADAATFNRSGNTVSRDIALGPDADTLNRTGTAVSGHIALGPDVDTLNRSGASVSGQVATGADADTVNKSGVAVSRAVCSGSKQVIYGETGASTVGATIGRAVDVDLVNRAGAASSSLVAAGADASTFNRTGVSVSGHVATGVAVKGIINKSGSSSTKLIATGLDADTLNRAGNSVSDHIATGADADTLNRSGNSVSDHIATGPSNEVQQNTGVDVSRLVATGADAVTFQETGASVSDHVATGKKAVIYQKTGVAVSGHDATGVRAMVRSRTGVSITNQAATGFRSGAIQKTGVSVSGQIATGADVSTFQETGASVSDHIASGASSRFALYQKTGASVSKLVATGQDADTLNRTGVSTSDHVATGPTAEFQQNSGSSTSDHIAMGADEATFNRTGKSVETSAASGTKSVSVGGKTGVSVSDHYATGARSVVYSKTGTSVSGHDAAGGDAATITKRGVSTEQSVATGLKAVTYSETGRTVNVMSATGTRLKAMGRTGAATLTTIGRGSRNVTVSRTGLSTARCYTRGVDVDTVVRTGSSSVELFASGDRGGVLHFIQHGSSTARLYAGGAVRRRHIVGGSRTGTDYAPGQDDGGTGVTVGSSGTGARTTTGETNVG